MVFFSCFLEDCLFLSQNLILVLPVLVLQVKLRSLLNCFVSGINIYTAMLEIEPLVCIRNKMWYGYIHILSWHVHTWPESSGKQTQEWNIKHSALLCPDLQHSSNHIPIPKTYPWDVLLCSLPSGSWVQSQGCASTPSTAEFTIGR